jgi:hypothetical protein
MRDRERNRLVEGYQLARSSYQGPANSASSYPRELSESETFAPFFHLFDQRGPSCPVGYKGGTDAEKPLQRISREFLFRGGIARDNFGSRRDARRIRPWSDGDRVSPCHADDLTIKAGRG